jgi:hypothetical protein
MVYLANTIDEKPTAEAQRRREKRRKSKTRNPETRRERRKNMEESEDCGVVTMARRFRGLVKILPTLRYTSKKPPSVSSVFFLRSLRVSGFLVFGFYSISMQSP